MFWNHTDLVANYNSKLRIRLNHIILLSLYIKNGNQNFLCGSWDSTNSSITMSKFLNLFKFYLPVL